MNEEIDNRPKSPLEAAIDAATGFAPGDGNCAMDGAAQDGAGEGGGAEAAETGPASETKPADGETKPADGETKPAETKENAAPVKEKHDWVEEAYACFVKNAVDMEPTDPVGAIKAYFEKNATDELKAKVKAEGKTADSCWKFIEEVARKALGGRSGHIDPVAIYAIAMHYFQDVPKDWDAAKKEKVKTKSEKVKEVAKAKDLDAKAAARARKIAHEKRVKLAAELGDEKFSEKVAAEGRELAKVEAKKPRAKPKAGKSGKKRGGEQGFFFDLMETEPVGPDAGDGGVSAAAQDGEEAGDAE